MPSPVRTYTDNLGRSFLVLDNGAQVRLPDVGTGGEPTTPGEVTEHEVAISPSQPTDPLAEVWVDPDDDADANLYVLKTGDTMTGHLGLTDGTTRRRIGIATTSGGTGMRVLDGGTGNTMATLGVAEPTVPEHATTKAREDNANPYIIRSYAQLTDANGDVFITWPAEFMGKRPVVVATPQTPNYVCATQVITHTAVQGHFRTHRIGSAGAASGIEVHVVAMVTR